MFWKIEQNEGWKFCRLKSWFKVWVTIPKYDASVTKDVNNVAPVSNADESTMKHSWSQIYLWLRLCGGATSCSHFLLQGHRVSTAAKLTNETPVAFIRRSQLQFLNLTWPSSMKPESKGHWFTGCEVMFPHWHLISSLRHGFARKISHYFRIISPLPKAFWKIAKMQREYVSHRTPLTEFILGSFHACSYSISLLHGH